MLHYWWRASLKRCHSNTFRISLYPKFPCLGLHQLPLSLPLNAICVVLPQGARSSLSSSSSHMTSDMPSDPPGPLQGCSPWTLTIRALLCHLSPTRKPCLSDFSQLGPTHSGLSLSGENEDEDEEKAISKVPLSVRFIHQRWGVAVLLSGRDKAKVWELNT